MNYVTITGMPNSTTRCFELTSEESRPKLPHPIWSGIEGKLLALWRLRYISECLKSPEPSASLELRRLNHVIELMKIDYEEEHGMVRRA